MEIRFSNIFFRGKEWTNKYNSDFSYVLQNKSNLNENEEDEEEEFRMSLITGKMERNAKYNKQIQNSHSTECMFWNISIKILYL